MGSTEREAYYFLPFGEEIVAPVNGRSTSMGYPSSPDALLEKFTGHARDTETANINSMTGLDWMRARYYSSSQGRFQSVDPANAGASVGDPQSWNGYSYVGNNPLNYTDPDGRDPIGGSSLCGFGPWGCVAGIAANLCRMFCDDLFGGKASPAAPKIMTGGGIGNSPEVWSERAPTGGGVNTGGVYGGGCGANGICSFADREWWEHDWVQNAANLIAGAGDTLSFNLSAKFRKYMGNGRDTRNYCSGYYTAGEWTGTGLSIAYGGLAGIEKAGVKAAGKEFSHWIPKRMGGPRTILNGNYVTPVEHALSDPYRYRFMKRVWKEANPLPSAVTQQWNRIPYVLKGTAAGATWGAVGQMVSGESCGN